MTPQEAFNKSATEQATQKQCGVCKRPVDKKHGECRPRNNTK